MVHEHDSCELVVKIQYDLSWVERLILIFILLIAHIMCSVNERINHIHQEACQEPPDLVKHPGALCGIHLTPILIGQSLDIPDQFLGCLDCIQTVSGLSPAQIRCQRLSAKLGPVHILYDYLGSTRLCLGLGLKCLQTMSVKEDPYQPGFLSVTSRP